MRIFNKKKKDKLALDLQIPQNQKAAIRASLDNKVILINMGNGLFVVDMKSAKGDKLENFLGQFISNSINCNQGIVDDEDDRCNYYLIYDLKEE